MSAAPPKIEGWDHIPAPARAGNGTILPAVTVSALSSGGRYQPTLIVVFDPRCFGNDAPPAWLAPGSKVWVLRGRGEFLRTLRLVPNGTHLLRKTPRGGNCRLNIPALAGHPKEGAPRTAVEFDFGDGWFDITLPDWHGPHPNAPARPVAQAAPPAAKPFGLAPGVSSHPGWNSPKAAAEHARAVKGGAA